MEEKRITSGQNPKIRRLLHLQQKANERHTHGLFVVEGQREISHCMKSGYELDTLFCCPEIMQRSDVDNADLQFVLSKAQEANVYDVSPAVYAKIAYRSGTEGVVAEMKLKEHTLDDLQLPENPLVVVLESVEKPGNLGAILRTADAAGVDAVIVSDPRTDIYNPNLIRSSVGAFFTVPCVACSSEECIAFLKAKNIQILTAQLQDSSLYYDIDMKRGTAIVMGKESSGLTEQWRNAADAHIRIPMLGQLDSLNVSVSAAVLMYEAVRQRSLVIV